MATVRGTIIFNVPLSNPSISRIALECGLEISFDCGFGFYQGADAQETASLIGDAINFACNSATILDLRTNNNIVASVFDRTVTIELDVDDTCCGQNVEIFDKDDSPEAWTPIRGGRVLTCEPFSPDLSTIDCTKYPPNTHIFRFKFINDSGTIFGAGGSDYRYAVDPSNALTGGIVPDCISSLTYYPQLSVITYATENDFYNGWAQFVNDAVWTPSYNGTCTHLGGGVMEMITDIATWNARFPESPICETGLSVVCVFQGEPTNDGLNAEIIAQACCIPTPEEPPVDPEFPTPEEIQQPLDARCFSILEFICCKFGAPGVSRLIAMDRVYFGGVCLDEEGRISYIETGNRAWTELCVKFSATQLSAEEQRDENGVRYVHTLNTQVGVMTHENRNTIMKLAQRPLLLIVQDVNKRYWLMGEMYPVRTREHKSTTGATSGSSEHTFVFTDTSTHHIREITKDFVEGNGYNDGIIIGTVDCDNLTPNIDVELDPLRTCYLFDKKALFLND